MSTYRLLVIDDQWDTRKAGYERVFQHCDGFDLAHCGPESALNIIHDTPAHGYVVDVRLGDDANYFESIIRDISEKRRPVMLLSSKWSERGTLDLLSRLDLNQRAQIRYFIAWDDHWESGDLVESVATSTCKNIRLALDQHYLRSAITPDADQSVSVLHLADLQFGDPDAAADSFLDENEIADNVRKHGVVFVAITGDVAYSGHPDEYRKAEDWFRRLGKRLWPGKAMSEHLLIVPGNHDVDLRLCAAGGYDYQFPDPKVADDKWKLVGRALPATVYSGMAHYMEFLYRLTDDESWLHPETALFKCQDRFLGYGIRFIHLASPLAASVDAPGRCQLDANTLRSLADDVDQRNQLENADSLFTVVLSHHGFPCRDVAGKDYVGFENGEGVTRFMDRVRADLLLFGHGHGMLARQRQDSPLCGMIEVMAPALRLKQKLRQEDELRGFNVIKFNRTLGRVSKVELKAYEIRTGRIHERPADGLREWLPRTQFCGNLTVNH